MQLAESSDKNPAGAGFSVEPQSPTIGAFIRGLDLRESQSEAVISGISKALTQWKVLFFRDQFLTEAQHIQFADRFGELEIHPLTPSEQENPEILRITHDRDSRGTENFWHSDVTWRPEPSLGSILRAVEVPETGGDTLWADMETAYMELPDTVKERVDSLQAEHNFLRAFGPSIPEEKHDRIREKHPVQYHPVIRTHPDSGRKSIYVNIAFTDRIMGVEKEESDYLLDALQSTAGRPEYQVRLKWQPGTIAFWDNRSSQHYAVSDYWPQRRVMERVTVCGSKPF